MRKLDINEFKICQILGRIFLSSRTLSHLSSPMFIRRFMNYEGSRCFFDKSYLSSSNNEEEVILELNDLYEPSHNKILYGEKEMYWIGYIYGAISFLYQLSPKTVYALFPSKEIISYYPIYHTFDVEEASERMMENIGYEEKDYVSRGVAIYKKLLMMDKLKELLGKKVKVHIDDSSKGNILQASYGYLEDFLSSDGSRQEVYVLGADEVGEEFSGVAYAIIERKDEGKDKLVVVKEGSEYSNQEIRKAIAHKEKPFKHKIIRQASL